MTKKEMKDQLRDIKRELQDILNKESIESYEGDENDEFIDCVSIVFGSIDEVIDDINNALKS